MPLNLGLGTILAVLVALGSATARTAVSTMESPDEEKVAEIEDTRLDEVTSELAALFIETQEYVEESDAEFSPDDLTEQAVVTRILRELLDSENDHGDSKHIHDLNEQLEYLFEPQRTYRECRDHARFAGVWFVLGFSGSMALIVGFLLVPNLSEIVSATSGTLVFFVFGLGLMESGQALWKSESLNRMVEENKFRIGVADPRDIGYFLRIGAFTGLVLIFGLLIMGILLLSWIQLPL